MGGEMSVDITPILRIRGFPKLSPIRVAKANYGTTKIEQTSVWFVEKFLWVHSLAEPTTETWGFGAPTIDGRPDVLLCLPRGGLRFAAGARQGKDSTKRCKLRSHTTPPSLPPFHSSSN
ncbi:hypothetical protein PoB_004882000 [Plakobranchus ocellatus]|uniref:Uncharacterized protein n=1 Tax=Plakobranchus ocellatus TaxID=259542 RepID=A0AAV4BP32_9GAST|nr:hypothetical protein PoB_004882000 [Plakobranchus ocellatus]